MIDPALQLAEDLLHQMKDDAKKNMEKVQEIFHNAIELHGKDSDAGLSLISLLETLELKPYKTITRENFKKGNRQ